MKSSSYLFGCKIDKEIIQMQEKVAVYKIYKAKKLLKKLLRKSLLDMSSEENQRVEDVLKAIKFWENILREHR